MPAYHRYRRPAPAGSFVVRIARAEDQIVGFVREIDESDDEEATYPTEQVAVEDALALAEARRKELGGEVFIELEPGVQWQPAWGELRD